MDGCAYAVVNNSPKRATGDGKQATGNLGTPVFASQGGTRGYNRPACAVFVSQGGQRSYEGGVRNDRHSSFVIGHLQRQTAGNRDSGTGDEETAKMADGGQRPETGIRGPAPGIRGSWLVARFTAENAESNTRPRTRRSCVFSACPASGRVFWSCPSLVAPSWRRAVLRRLQAAFPPRGRRVAPTF